MMDWLKLLNPDRLGAGSQPPSRRGFDRDYQRVLFSRPFRRLLDKTQVFPMPANDHVHNRLIHSVEVASVGRTLGTWVGERLRGAGILAESVAPSSLGDIVASACLMHDIGNPPFGHAGEDAIAAWFRGNGATLISDLSDAEQRDLQHFEGNAQSFRVVTRLEMYGEDQGGMQLTFATLGAVAKYPQASVHQQKGHVARKKFGYFQADDVLFEQVATALGLTLIESGSWTRHPLAYLVEAADDMCYSILDLEDGYTLGFVDYAKIIELLIALLEGEPNTTATAPRERVAHLRARAISRLVEQLVEAFVEHHDVILMGDLDKPLADLIPAHAALESIKDHTRRLCYQAPEVLRIELAGYEVLGGLLEVFANAVHQEKPDRRQRRALDLMHLNPRQKDESCYSRLLRVTDYLSGMTDGFALRLYKELRGIELPGVQGRAERE